MVFDQFDIAFAVAKSWPLRTKLGRYLYSPANERTIRTEDDRSDGRSQLAAAGDWHPVGLVRASAAKKQLRLDGARRGQHVGCGRLGNQNARRPRSAPRFFADGRPVVPRGDSGLARTDRARLEGSPRNGKDAARGAKNYRVGVRMHALFRDGESAGPGAVRG